MKIIYEVIWKRADCNRFKGYKVWPAGDLCIFSETEADFIAVPDHDRFFGKAIRKKLLKEK